MNIVLAVAVIAVATLAAFGIFRKRRTQKLRLQFGGSEYDRAISKDGSRRDGEAALQGRNERVEALHIRALSSAEEVRFAETWRVVQGHFLNAPGFAVALADQLLRDLMLKRGYSVSDFDETADDVSVDHPLVIENYRKAHETSIRQTEGRVATEDLRQAMMHYGALFDELVDSQELVHAKTAAE